jgi:hypothetical protein
MKNGTCPKCSQNTVHMNKKGITYHSNSSMYIHIPHGIMTMPFGDYTDYVCVSCGYFETYIDDPNKLDDLRQHWTKVNVA